MKYFVLQQTRARDVYSCVSSWLVKTKIAQKIDNPGYANETEQSPLVKILEY